MTKKTVKNAAITAAAYTGGFALAAGIIGVGHYETVKKRVKLAVKKNGRGFTR